MSQILTVQDEHANVERITSSLDLPAFGQWYWVKEEGYAKWFGCITKVGSNFFELRGPCSGNGYHSTRVHVDDVDQCLTFEPNYKAVLDSKVADARAELDRLMGELNALNASLGVGPMQRLQNQRAQGDNALAVLSTQVDIEGYKQALIEAKAEKIPALKESLRKATERLTAWMKAEVIVLDATIAENTDVVDGIKDRLFSIELYAGLTEEIVQFASGRPAVETEKLRVFQRMLFCDEEALLAYDDGGMDITNIQSFDAWLARPVNRDRILPYPRCVVAMRVRRNKKDRESDGTLRGLLRNMHLAEGDKYTFLFIRNGEQLYRISTAMEFDELIFPELSSFDPSEPMMMKTWGRRVDKVMTRREYDALCEIYADFLKWKEDRPPKETWWAGNYPRSSELGHFTPDDWKPFDDSSVYFDEAMAKLEAEIKAYNRVAVIIQGLFDRSECLLPHKRVRSWTQEGFAEAIELIYDGMGLTHGEPPSFEAYRLRCNAEINENSVLVGQERLWLLREGEAENRRRASSWRHHADSPTVTTFKPYGDPGPGYLAKPKKVMKRAEKVVFSWERKKRTRDRFDFAPQSTVSTLTVPFSELFNVSAYRAGDYRQFFADPRTREQYLKWAPLLMAAEDYIHGRKKVGPKDWRLED
ncbi:hypothetical protein [Pseudomonas sp. GOM6]|uniref:hypothetical protein n=1 Tax=Pseudomonas sp. GOM6 TaxID=3036944 RepID=UPI00240A558C|nr:hypothetical protein [Pseudomonas sp. GOM6]MDG1581063.1 hypothetical protein [Pseudomonas sp. GOM6]